MTAEIEPWQLPFGPFDPARLRPVSGDEAIVEQFTWGPPPVARLMPCRTAELHTGQAVFVAPASEWQVGARGTVPLGVLAVFADAALGVAAAAADPPRMTSTVTMQLAVVAPWPRGPLDARAEGRLIGDDGATALSDGLTFGAGGAPLFHGVARNTIAPRPENPGLAPTGAAGGADPVDLPLLGSVIDPATWVELGARGVFEGQMAGDLPRSPLQRLTGMRLASMGDSRAVLATPASVWLANPFGVIQGGVHMLLAEQAMEAAVASTLGPGVDVRLVDIRANYLRPAPADGTQLETRALALQVGRTTAVCTADIVRADGKVATTCLATLRLNPST